MSKHDSVQVQERGAPPARGWGEREKEIYLLFPLSSLKHVAGQVHVSEVLYSSAAVDQARRDFHAGASQDGSHWEGSSAVF